MVLWSRSAASSSLSDLDQRKSDCDLLVCSHGSEVCLYRPRNPVIAPTGPSGLDVAGSHGALPEC